MKKSKKLIYITSIIIILCIVARIYTKKQNNISYPIYLENKYYNNHTFIKVNSEELSKLKKENYILFTYNNYCTLPISCESIFEEFMKQYNIAFLSIPFEEFKNTYIYRKVKYAPSIIIISKGHIISYLDANSDDDLNKYQDVTEFKKWIEQYIYLTTNNETNK